MNKTLIFSLVFWSCSTLSAGQNVCEGLAEVFFLLASNKDTGATIESQTKMIGSKTDSESYQYMAGILKIIYSRPEFTAEEIKSSFLKTCKVNEKGQVDLPNSWDPWQQST